MSWSISNITNTPKISKKCAKELFEATGDEYFYDPDEVTYDGHLYFNGDHMEHMDYVHNDNVLQVLLKHKIKGDICFGSLEGDNEGEFWGYRFDGLGGMVRLKGKLTFDEVPHERTAS